MHLLRSSCYLLTALSQLDTSDAKLNRKDLVKAHGTLVERQSSDGADASGGTSLGDASGVQQAPAQTQNITSTTGATEGTGNGTDTASPGYITQPGDVDESQVVCTNITTGRANRCWAELSLTEWVENWSNDNSNKCYEYEGFSTCFLRQNGFPGLDCSQIAPGACDAPQNSLTVNLLTNPEVFYVAYNLYGMTHVQTLGRRHADRHFCSCQPIFLFLVYCSRQLGGHCC